VQLEGLSKFKNQIISSGINHKKKGKTIFWGGNKGVKTFF
jgi:hypothetical protein